MKINISNLNSWIICPKPNPQAALCLFCLSSSPLKIGLKNFISEVAAPKRWINSYAWA
ncbi:hypothetical protein GXM_08299 [Nostoc sphaeroides CCNUC1]|uniref:Uncharacterized protein n=1 Tax=Nostoc sphaeroides CCNUC1 TaxID=2653204 RepID=A0A5P8WDB1_9NOSO|nr:hypothetical protein GXM_08299 [Nostoc sphaeroides CCNUC1]